MPSAGTARWLCALSLAALREGLVFFHPWSPGNCCPCEGQGRPSSPLAAVLGPVVGPEEVLGAAPGAEGPARKGAPAAPRSFFDLALDALGW
eukprot:8267179-Lingulodinium_polyedra.AAC.1